MLEPYEPLELWIHFKSYCPISHAANPREFLTTLKTWIKPNICINRWKALLNCTHIKTDLCVDCFLKSSCASPLFTHYLIPNPQRGVPTSESISVVIFSSFSPDDHVPKYTGLRVPTCSHLQPALVTHNNNNHATRGSDVAYVFVFSFVREKNMSTLLLITMHTPQRTV